MQLICLIDKIEIRIDTIFKEDLTMSRLNAILSGYNTILPEFIEYIKVEAFTRGNYRSAHIDLEKLSVTQL